MREFRLQDVQLRVAQVADESFSHIVDNPVLNDLVAWSRTEELPGYPECSTVQGCLQSVQ
ncbi:MAG TPA: hypothetical protein VGN17_01415 [Bryobacteraceae bacterium]